MRLPLAPHFSFLSFLSLEPLAPSSLTHTHTTRFATLKKGDLERYQLVNKRLARYIEGEIELRSLRHLYKLSFTNARVVSLFREPEEESDSDDDDLFAAQKSAAARIKLRLYMSKKKPKSRMADIEETGHPVNCADSKDGFFDLLVGKGANPTTFDVAMRDVPDIASYAGCVIVKPKAEPPMTDEPIVFGYARFGSGGKELIGTDNALNMADDKSKLAKLAKAGKSAMPGLQSIGFYSRLAKSAWQLLELTEEDEVNYKSTFRR